MRSRPSASSLRGWFVGAGTPQPVEGLPQTCFWQADSLTSLAPAWGRARGPRRRAPGLATRESRATRDGTREPIEAILFLVAFAGTGSWRRAGTSARAHRARDRHAARDRARRPEGRPGCCRWRSSLLVTSLVSFALLVLGAALWLVATGTPMLDANAALLGQGYRVESAGPAAVAFPDTSTAILGLAVVLLIAGLGSLVARAVPRVDPNGVLRGLRPGRHLPRDRVEDRGARRAAGGAASGQRPRRLRPRFHRVARRAQHDRRQHHGVEAERRGAPPRVVDCRAGGLPLPLVSVSSSGNRAAGIYLLTYVAATAVAFAVVALMVRERSGAGRSSSPMRARGAAARGAQEPWGWP